MLIAKMNIIAILGSPRRGGNSELLLDEAIAGVRSSGARVEKIVLSELKFVPCQNCGGCDKTGICIVKDDMQPIYKKLKSADGIILASPIFFGSISAQAKAMIDRCQSVWVAKYVLKKRTKKARKGIFLSVSGSGERKFFLAAKKVAKYFFATNDIEYTGDLFAPKADKKGDIKKYPGALKRSYKLGEGLALACKI